MTKQTHISIDLQSVWLPREHTTGEDHTVEGGYGDEKDRNIRNE